MRILIGIVVVSIALPVICPAQISMGRPGLDVGQVKERKGTTAAAKPQAGFSPEEQRRVVDVLNRMTPKARKQLDKAVKRMTPEQRKQLIAALKIQLAKGMAPQAARRTR